MPVQTEGKAHPARLLPPEPQGLRREGKNGQAACDSPLTLYHHAEHCLAVGKGWSRKGRGGALAASAGSVHMHSATG